MLSKWMSPSMHRTFLAATLSLGVATGAAACGSSSSTDESADESKDTKDTKDTKDEAKDEAKDVKDEGKGAETGGGPSIDLKELVVVDQAGFKAVYDPDASVWRWESDDYFSSIVVRKLDAKVTNVEELKTEGPMMMALGTTITKVVSEGKGENGWFAVVEMDGSQTFIYIMKLGGLEFTCSASLKNPGMGKTHTEAGVKKACESIKVK